MKASAVGFNPDYNEEAPTLEKINAKEGYTLLEFGAPWCRHCQAATQMIKATLSKAQLMHIKVFDGKGKKLGRHFGVTLWPTLILLKSGKEVERVVRPTESHAIEALLALAE